jgi:crossover junction endodeoxyribonuclease RusA
MGTARITFPWFPRELAPNARVHHMARARAAKAYRTQCGWIARASSVAAPSGPEIMLGVTFNPPSNRGDTDNMIAGAKSCLDGLADAWSINDRAFAFTFRRAEPVKGGQIVVEVNHDA